MDEIRAWDDELVRLNTVLSTPDGQVPWQSKPMTRFAARGLLEYGIPWGARVDTFVDEFSDDAESSFPVVWAEVIPASSN